MEQTGRVARDHTPKGGYPLEGSLRGRKGGIELIDAVHFLDIARPTGVEREMTQSGKVRVLYLEDDEDSLEMVTFMLGLAGMEVVGAAEAEEAASLAKNETFDLYLLDGLIPCGNSIELCQMLRQNSPTTPIVFYSALGFPTDVRKGLDAGANAYLVKPYAGDLAETLTKIILGAKAGARQAAVQ